MGAPDSSDSGSECDSEGSQADAARLEEEVLRAIQVAVISAVLQEVDSTGTECESGSIILSDQHGGAGPATGQQQSRRKASAAAAAAAVAEAAATAQKEELQMAAAVDRWFAMASNGMYNDGGQLYDQWVVDQLQQVPAAEAVGRRRNWLKRFNRNRSAREAADEQANQREAGARPPRPASKFLKKRKNNTEEPALAGAAGAGGAEGRDDGGKFTAGGSRQKKRTPAEASKPGLDMDALSRAANRKGKAPTAALGNLKKKEQDQWEIAFMYAAKALATRWKPVKAEVGRAQASSDGQRKEELWAVIVEETKEKHPDCNWVDPGTKKGRWKGLPARVLGKHNMVSTPYLLSRVMPFAR